MTPGDREDAAGLSPNELGDLAWAVGVAFPNLKDKREQLLAALVRVTPAAAAPSGGVGEPGES